LLNRIFFLLLKTQNAVEHISLVPSSVVPQVHPDGVVLGGSGSECVPIVFDDLPLSMVAPTFQESPCLLTCSPVETPQCYPDGGSMANSDLDRISDIVTKPQVSLLKELDHGIDKFFGWMNTSIIKQPAMGAVHSV